MSIPEYAEIYYSNYDFVYMPNINTQIPKIPNYNISISYFDYYSKQYNIIDKLFRISLIPKLYYVEYIIRKHYSSNAMY